MDTNFHMLRELLEKYHPEQHGIMSIEEHDLIKETLHIGAMDILQLRNLRDFTVLYMSRSEKREDLDRMSAITHVIDMIISELGGEVQLQIKYWMYQPEQMLIVTFPEEYVAKENYISTLLAAIYSIWINPEESYDDEDAIEAVYDAECAIYLMNELQEEYGYKLDWTVSDCENEDDADYTLVGL